jgi:hypothetical protein
MRIVIAALAMVSLAADRKTENIVICTLDGLRWQEAFNGANDELLNKDRGGVDNIKLFKEHYWRESPAERREVLMPFLWKTVAKQGQIYGNRTAKSPGSVTNRLNFSYPGYSELLCGYPDPAIASNSKVNNRNVTVLEWLNIQPSLKGHVAAFGSWEVFPWIINTERNGIPVNAGNTPLTGVPESPEVALLNRLIVETPPVGEETRLDVLTYHAAKLYVKAKSPRVLFLSFDETDAHGHAGRYDRLLSSATKNDAMIADLWATLQAMPQYKDRTSLIITTDHGRGDPPVDWKSHSATIAGSETWWVAVMGPDTAALGERKDVPAVTQSQVAATAAALLGYDYGAAVPKAGPKIADVLPK